MGNIGKQIKRRIRNPKRPGIPIKIPEKIPVWEPIEKPELEPAVKEPEKANAS